MAACLTWQLGYFVLAALVSRGVLVLILAYESLFYRSGCYPGMYLFQEVADLIPWSLIVPGGGCLIPLNVTVGVLVPGGWLRLA